MYKKTIPFSITIQVIHQIFFFNGGSCKLKPEYIEKKKNNMENIQQNQAYKKNN
jgi:heat shock protein HspQ